MYHFPYIWVIALIFIITSLIRKASKRQQHPGKTTNHHVPFQEDLSSREALVLQLIKERQILELPRLKDLAAISEIEINRILGKLLRLGYLEGYYINYRTKSLKLRDPATSSATPPDFVPGIRSCTGCGAKTYLDQPGKTCPYCGVPLPTKDN